MIYQIWACNKLVTSHLIYTSAVLGICYTGAQQKYPVAFDAHCQIGLWSEEVNQRILNRMCK